MGIVKEAGQFFSPARSREVNDSLRELRRILAGTYIPVDPSIVNGENTEGATSNVYFASDNPEHCFVVKVGRSKIIPPGGLLPFGVSTKTADRMSRVIFGNKGKFANTPDFVREGVKEYELIREYFGNPSDEQKAQLSRSKILSSLKDSNSSFYKTVAQITGSRPDKMRKIADVFESYKGENFLVREGTVMSVPTDRSQRELDKMRKKGKVLVSSIIIQEEVTGDVVPLSDVKREDLKQRPELLERLLVFALIQKAMYEFTDKMIDTRPREGLKHAFEWFQKTANILVDKNTDRIFFIDTRLLWDRTPQIDLLYGRCVNKAIKEYTQLLAID